MSFNNEKGSALLYVTGTILLLSALTQVALWNFDVSLLTFRAYNEQRRAFYVSEGVRNLVTVLMETFLMTDPNPVGSDISAFLNNNLPPLVPAPYTVSQVQVQVLKVIPNALLPTGPFSGMNGPITNLTTNFTISTPSSVFSGQLSQPMNLQLSLAYISMFQFMVFYDTAQGFLQTGPDLMVNGRMHANSDLCIGSDSGTEYFLKLTAGGRLMNNTDSRCGTAAGSTISNVKISVDGGFTNFASMSVNYDNGCTNCNGSGLAWQTFSLSRWHQQALDQANAVPQLTLPGAGMGLVQLNQAGGWAPVSNNVDLRFIIDPVLATDSPVVESYKFASNADLRIINGVWYIKDPALPLAWPGLPIWSDHPGRFTENALDVGQDDIRQRWAGTRPWPAAPATPTNYSYYAFDYTNQTLFTSTAGGAALSYGNLFATGTRPSAWVPGDWVTSGPSAFCLGNAAISCAGGCGLLNPWSTSPTCGGAASPGRDPGYASQILNATRGGFRNGHIYMISPGNATQRSNRSRILPVNLDVQMLQNALNNTNPGELGSYFPAHSSFNGIVYISSVWPGGISGFGTGGPNEFPYQGSVTDTTNQISPTHPAVQQALPQPLCSNNTGLGVAAMAYAGTAFDSQGPLATPVVRFNVPDCAAYAAGGAIQAYPNAIRLVNASHLDDTTLPNGLSIVSNLPVYMTGDYNSSSIVTSSTATPWVSSLVAGDKVVELSNAWNDANSRWDIDPSNIDRLASNTTYNTALLTEPTTNLTVLLEDWTGQNLTVNGSMVFGYNEVYALHANYCCGNVTYQPPNRTFNFDPHFGYITNQPPGTPVFPVSAILQWNNAP